MFGAIFRLHFQIVSLAEMNRFEIELRTTDGA